MPGLPVLLIGTRLRNLGPELKNRCDRIKTRRCQSRPFVFAFAAVAIWLGLAVWGWDGIGPFFAHPARVALVLVTVGLMIASLFTRGNLSSGEKEDRGNRWVLYVFPVIGLADGFFPLTATVLISGPLVATMCAGWALRSSRLVECCDCGRCLC
jgi:hypothetical protein